jgi:hypothetical protein
MAEISRREKFPFNLKCFSFGEKETTVASSTDVLKETTLVLFFAEVHGNFIKCRVE